MSAFTSRASPIAKARSTPSTTATLRWIAARTDDRTETWTTTRAVSGASTGFGTPVTTPATHHDRPAANPDLATMPISVDVGRVHAMASTARCHSARTRLPEGSVATGLRCGRHRLRPIDSIVSASDRHHRQRVRNHPVVGGHQPPRSFVPSFSSRAVFRRLAGGRATMFNGCSMVDEAIVIGVRIPGGAWP